MFIKSYKKYNILIALRNKEKRKQSGGYKGKDSWNLRLKKKDNIEIFKQPNRRYTWGNKIEL